MVLGAPNALDDYQEQQITCTLNGNWKSCSGKGVTLGWGGPGGLSAWYFNSNPNKWTKIETGRGSSTTLSQFGGINIRLNRHFGLQILRKQLTYLNDPPRKYADPAQHEVRNSVTTSVGFYASF